MAAFEKGHKKTGGRAPGTPNRVTSDLKALLAEYKSDDDLRARWDYFWNHRNPFLRWRVFEVYLHYRFGKPMTIVAGPEEQPPIKIDISAIPKFRQVSRSSEAAVISPGLGSCFIGDLYTPQPPRAHRRRAAGCLPFRFRAISLFLCLH